jgi:hypothetical protein
MTVTGMAAGASDEMEYEFGESNLSPSYSDENRTKLIDGVVNGPWGICVGWREIKPCPIMFTFPKEKTFSQVKVFAFGIDSGGGIGTPQNIRVYSGDKVVEDKLIGETALTPQKKGWIEISIKSGVSSNIFTIDIGSVLYGDEDFKWIMISEIEFE